MSAASAPAVAAPRARWLPWLVLLLTLAIYGGAIVWVRQNLWDKLRAQIVNREGELFNAVFLTLLQQVADEGEESIQDLARDPAGQLELMLRASEQFEKIAGPLRRSKSFLAARIFDPQGRLLNTFPPSVTETELSPQNLDQLRTLRAVSHYFPEARLGDVFMQLPVDLRAGAESVPLLQVSLPLHLPDDDRLLGVAQFVLVGQTLATLDQELRGHAWLAFVAGSVVIVVALGWAFRRLQRTNRLLAERTATLLRANHELSMAAKTSAVGAVASHLIHGLKNPLFGLHHFVASRSNGQGVHAESDWQAAVETTRRLQQMIDDVVRVLREETAGAAYEISLGELCALLTARLEPQARAAQVRFLHELTADGALSNRNANLVLLILENLLQNAIQATPAGRTVRLAIAAAGDEVRCLVRDEGPGLPESVRAALFHPVSSSKPNGTGIGLAISRQLANHLGAQLELESSTPQGCVFALTLPAELLVGATASVPDRSPA
jgi:signal transduction histidine kinase